MLVLRRKAKEGIVLSENIRVVILAIEGGRVKIGIEAPRGITVVREELLRRQPQVRKETAS
jgi:carbon storage regulator